MLSSYYTFLDFGVKIDIVDLCCFWYFLLKKFISKTASVRYVYDKVPSAKWPHKPGEDIMCLSTSGLYIVFYHQNLDFKLRPLLRCLCRINSFYRRYASCMCNISNIYPIYRIDPIYMLWKKNTRDPVPWNGKVNTSFCLDYV